MSDATFGNGNGLDQQVPKNPFSFAKPIEMFYTRYGLQPLSPKYRATYLLLTLLL